MPLQEMKQNRDFMKGVHFLPDSAKNIVLSLRPPTSHSGHSGGGGFDGKARGKGFLNGNGDAARSSSSSSLLLSSSSLLPIL